MNLSPEEQRLVRMLRALDSFARNTYMITLGKEIMDRYAVNIGVIMCESDRIAQQRTELSDEMRHQYEERLWASRPPLWVDGQDVSERLIPSLSTISLFAIIFGYPWNNTDAELIEFLADEIFIEGATREETEKVRRWIEAWRNKVLNSIEIQGNA